MAVFHEMLAGSTLALTKSITCVSTTPNEQSGTTTTVHANLTAGPPAPGRILMAMVYAQGLSHSVTGVTIGGVPATFRAGTSGSSFASTYIYTAVVPTGTLVDVVMTNNQSNAAYGVSLFSAIGYNNTNWNSGFWDHANNWSSQLANVTVGTVAGGGAVAIYRAANIDPTSSRTWGNLTETNAEFGVDTSATAVAPDIKLFALAENTNTSGLSTNFSIDLSDTVRRRPTLSVATFD